MSIVFQQELTAVSTGTDHITPRETEILHLMAQGNMNKEIAGQLNISPETVKKHIKNIFQKIGAHNRIEALNKTRWLTSSLASNQY
ncbi:MAG TPA: helix-turn-helix transcriptional regulator [Flavisolibacter sp.]|nr:helix-turn-helix transcriptional regulator [Flavisolibacter sp.]